MLIKNTNHSACPLSFCYAKVIRGAGYRPPTQNRPASYHSCAAGKCGMAPGAKDAVAIQRI